VGRDRAGSAAAQGKLWDLQNEEIRKLAEVNATTINEISKQSVPTFRVVVNDRLDPGERFVTLAHELAHIFCGHLGACRSRKSREDDALIAPAPEYFSCPRFGSLGVLFCGATCLCFNGGNFC
jgi:hypothetical protein